MSFFSDLKVVYHLVLKPTRGADHAARMDNFYSGQENAYDNFRKRLLLGREQLWREMMSENASVTPNEQTLDGKIWCDMGGGTGANLHFFGDAINQLQKVYVVDLAQSLLSVTQKRIAANNWTNATAITADATTWIPPEKQVDFVTFSYSLTMIPDWFAAIDHAISLLKPGGKIGVVDFYLSRKFPAADNVRHSWLKRTFWVPWFASDNVFPSPDHLPYLQRRCEQISLTEGLTRIPFFPNPFFKMPHYIFVGRKRDDTRVG